jgi:hypothetical protein
LVAFPEGDITVQIGEDKLVPRYKSFSLRVEKGINNP